MMNRTCTIRSCGGSQGRASAQPDNLALRPAHSRPHPDRNNRVYLLRKFAPALLLIFADVLLGVCFDEMATLMAKCLRSSRGVAFALVIVIARVWCAVFIWLIAPQVASEGQMLTERSRNTIRAASPLTVVAIVLIQTLYVQDIPGGGSGGAGGTRAERSDLTGLCAFSMVRDTGFEPVTPTVSR